MPVKRIFLSLLLLVFFLPSVSPQYPVENSVYEDEESDEDEFLLLEGEGITITATQQTSQKMEIIDRDEIERHNAADLAELLQETLGLNITRYGAYGSMANINLRGVDTKRLAFLIDGVPVNSAMDGRFEIEQIDLNSVESIEVIYGGSDAKYNVSGAMGGVINIITVKKQKSGLRIGASLSNTSVMPGEYRDRGGMTGGPDWEDLLDTQNFTLSAAYGGNGLSVTAGMFANRAENHFLFTDRYGYTRRKDNNEIWDTGLTASLVWEFSDLSKLIFSPNFYYGNKNIPTSGFSGNYGRQQDISSRSNLMFDMPRAFRDDLAMEASLGWYFLGTNYTSPADALSRHNQQNIIAINRWSWYPNNSLTLRTGFDYRFIYLDSTEAGGRNRHDGGVYLTAEYSPFESFLVIPSVKAALTTDKQGGITPVPKLGLLWNINDSFTLKNNWFRSFKFPDFQDLYWAEDGGVTGNPDLKPEDGWGADLGLIWLYGDLFSLDSTFFASWLKDSIHWYPGPGGIWRPENVGEAFLFGLDIKLRVEIPVLIGQVKKIVPGISYQYMPSRLLSYGYTWDSGKRIPYMPEHILSGSLDIPWNTGSLIISVHYESLRFTDRTNLSKLKPHILLNANFNQKIGKNFGISAALRNILNESYESFADYPMPGISLTVGVRLEYETNREAK